MTWLDSLQRPELIYLFPVRSESDWPQDLMLLEQTRVSVYDNELRPPGNWSAWNEAFFFKPDGSYYGVKRGSSQLRV